jgi:signal transduction histidine kinase
MNAKRFALVAIVSNRWAGAQSRSRSSSLPPVVPLPPIAVDAPRISQVLRNLIANALVHTPPGGSVTLGVVGEARAVAIQVRDTGQGIAPEHLPHIFDRFYRADPSRDRATGGAGIGLSVARGIVQAHGGTIGVRSVVGQGTEFTITLPVMEPLSAGSLP